MAAKKRPKASKGAKISTRTFHLVLVKKNTDRGDVLLNKVKAALDTLGSGVFERKETVVVQVNGVGNGNGNGE
jgi:hypothetical protein